MCVRSLASPEGCPAPGREDGARPAGPCRIPFARIRSSAAPGGTVASGRSSGSGLAPVAFPSGPCGPDSGFSPGLGAGLPVPHPLRRRVRGGIRRCPSRTRTGHRRHHTSLFSPPTRCAPRGTDTSGGRDTTHPAEAATGASPDGSRPASRTLALLQRRTTSSSRRALGTLQVRSPSRKSVLIGPICSTTPRSPATSTGEPSGRLCLR